MRKQVILTLMEGSFEQGFPVLLRIREDGATSKTETQVIGRLPTAPYILEAFNNWQSAYGQWQSAYRQTVMHNFRIKPIPGVTNFSCRDLGSQLAERLNEWLKSDSNSREWQRIRDPLQRNLSETDEIQVIIQTEDIRLRQLPWHLWDLFSEHYRNAEIALSAPDYDPLPLKPKLNNKVKILAILGDSTGINVQKDRAILEQLPDAEITFLTEPQRQELNNQLWEQQWDILFFAGHSYSQVDGSTGQISINQNDSLSLKDLKNALTKAIFRGLQLAIFNSCDGLGLARELADLNIPQIIVMRKPVPDLVAQEFLKHFLSIFAQGTSLYLAVREARERLQGLEGDYPCASWLPVICQNPTTLPLTWQEMIRKNPPPPTRSWWQITPFRRRRAIAFSLTLLLVVLSKRLVSPPPAAGFSCGSSLQTYSVRNPSQSKIEGVRCVKFDKGGFHNFLPVFSWYGEGAWHNGKFKYRHLGHAFAQDSTQDTYRLRAYAADIFGNAEDAKEIFDKPLSIKLSSPVGTIPRTITVQDRNWDEIWELEEDNNVEGYSSPLNPEISTCGSDGFIEERGTDSIVRCKLKVQPQKPNSTSNYLTWYEEGKRHGFHYARIGIWDGSGYEVSDICKKSRFIGHCQLKSLLSSLVIVKSP